VAAFAPLLDLLAEVPDPRRAEGKLYKLPYVLLFSILAIVTGSNSYRGIVTFIDVHRRRLNEAFGLKWRCAPALTAIRYILQGLNPAAVEAVSRIRTSPGIVARLRSFAFNILSANQTDTLSQDRYRAALAGFDKLFKLFGVA
jgi:hypothetical protein